MMVELYIALKHIKARKFQSIACIIGVSLSLIVFICSISISNSLKNNTINSILNISPHISFEYNSDFDVVHNKLKELDIKDITKIYSSKDLNAFAKINDKTIFPYIKATDLSKFDIKYIKQSEKIEKNAVFIGESFAKRFNLDIGDTIDIISLKGKQIRLKVSRIFTTSISNLDNNLMLISMNIAKIIEQNDNLEYIVNIKVEDPSNIKKISSIKNTINDNLGVYSYTWYDENYTLLSAIKFEEFILLVILSLLFLISTFIIYIIQNISVREKTKDIGILSTFSYTKKQIKNIFILEGLILGIIGILISLVLSPVILKFIIYLFKKYLSTTYNIRYLQVVINIKELLFINIFALLLILLASYIPARTASKLDPVKAIKFNL